MKKQLTNRRRALIGWLGALAVLVAAIALWTRTDTTAARSGSPPPDRPQFEGIPVSESFPVRELNGRAAWQAPALATAWQVIFEEDWEAGFDSAVWTTVDRNGAANGEYKWGVRDVANPLGGGARSAWAVGGGSNGESRDLADGYPAGADSWLIYGPINLSTALDAELSFNYRFEADGGDTFSVLISTDNLSWDGQQTDDGGTGDWLERNFALDDYVGEPVVYLAFRFASNATGDNNKTAALVDDIAIRADYGSKQYLPHIQVQPTATTTATPTVMPTPTVTPTPPGGNFLDEFSGGINGWDPRRALVGANYTFGHRGDDDGGRQGQLEVVVNSTDSFVMLSPLVQAKAPPYNIEVVAKLKDPKDRQMYGIVFGGDWNGQPCTAPTPSSCFNRYYELRVQYRNFDGKQFQEMKLKRIDSHDANGEPIGPTLIDWVKGGNVGPDDWVEIDIYVEADGTINLTWNGRYRAEKQDATLINQPYFGLMLITRENGGARVKYDYIKID